MQQLPQDRAQLRHHSCREGQAHEFHFTTHLFLPGVTLDAFELRGGNPAGYQFQIIGDPEEDLRALFGRLVEKIRRGLSVKHLKRGDMGLQIAGDVVRGLTGSDEEDDGRVPLLVIDGDYLGAIRPHAADLGGLAVQARDFR